MTTAEALAKIIVAKYDNVPLDPIGRALVIEAIPPHCRFVDEESRIETYGTIATTLHFLTRPKPAIPELAEWTEEELDALVDER